MTRLLLAIIGMLSCALPALAAEDPSFKLYERMKEITAKDQLLGDSEEDVRTFVANVLKDAKDKKPLKAEDVKLALETRGWEFCIAREGLFGSCTDLYGRIQDTAARVSRFRTLGRDLLSIAQGYEMGVDGLMGEPLGITTKFSAIVHIWQSGADHLFSPSRELLVRAAPLPDNMDFSTLEKNLKDLKEDATNVIWRYRYGLRAVQEQKEEGKAENCEDKKGNGELFKTRTQRWCDVERALQSVIGALPTDPAKYDPPIEPNQTVLFPTQPLEDVPNATVWMTAKIVDGKITGDAGLSWDIPIETVLPEILPDDGAGDCMAEVNNKDYCDMVKDKKILPGGLYPDPPPEPKTWQGICALPLSKGSYLCRPRQGGDCSEEVNRDAASGTAPYPGSSSRSSSSERGNPRAIVLSRCMPEAYKYPTAQRLPGPDICRLGTWRTAISSSSSSTNRDSAQKDPDLRPDECSGCAVDIYCQETCPGNHTGMTTPKDANGVIQICLTSSYPKTSLPANLLHELTHAQQLCQLGAEEASAMNSVESCCTMEHDAYIVQCNIAAEEGILDKVHVSIDECASLMANTSCEILYGKNACTPLPGSSGSSSSRGEDRSQKLKEALKKAWQEKDRLRPDAPSCEKLINDLGKLEPRAAAIKEGLKYSCKPGCQTKYENTIGNNLCYVDQCTEESVEGSRLTPGRMPLTAEDQTFPWDACEAPDPKNGAILGLPADTSTSLPSYNPRRLLQALDIAICQSNGMPPATPPVLCSFLSSRRLDAPLGDYLSNAIDLGTQPGESLTATAGLEEMAPSLGARIGTTMFSGYLKQSLNTLKDLLQAANGLMSQMEKVRFPLVACPRNATEGNICSQLNP
ncbi:MAG: hypothetical protein PHE68_01755 [Candidatus Peribacteraceae bacterium]|nr:hypothetical protein [Candidatus Peribacteraceae bacterium]MDD5074372.1 hypothetical protein [Candidatus Peribacteraceae bacterium]